MSSLVDTPSRQGEPRAMKIMSQHLSVVLLEGALLLYAGQAIANETSLDARMASIEERASILERKSELAAEEASKGNASTPIVVAGDKGFALKSKDDTFTLKIRGVLQVDARHFPGDKNLRTGDTFLLRRVRPLLEATFYDITDFRLMTDFGNGQVTVQDAYADLRPYPWLKLRAGKFKPPVGLERLQSTSAIHFVERALPTALVPNRDVGVQLHGELGKGVFEYALGLWNGVVDGGSGDLDNGHAKDVVARFYSRPRKSDPFSILSGLGFGIAGSTGYRVGKPATSSASSSSALPSIKSSGQQIIFGYIVNDKVEGGTVLAEGRHYRLSPQLVYYTGGFGLLAEHVLSVHAVNKGGETAKLKHTAYQIEISQLLGAGKNTYEGVQVASPLSPTQGTWGVFEVALRFHELRLDKDTFPIYADSAKSVNRATAVAAAVNWHWSRNIKLAFTYDETRFQGGAPGTGDRKPERAFFERLQAAF